MAETKFRARFSTAGRLAPIENWLKLNIEGGWAIKMDSVSDDMSKKRYLLLFDDESDRNLFARRFTQRKAENEKVQQQTSPGLLNKVGALFSRDSS